MDNWEPEIPAIAKEKKDGNNDSLLNQGKYTVSDLIGGNVEEAFLNFDLTEIKELLSNLQNTDTPDLSHVELLQKQSLRCADLLANYLGKLTKTISLLDSKMTSKKNKVSLEYKAPEGSRTSIELRKMAGESSDDVQELASTLAKAKGAKSALDKKYDIVVKLHHYYKDIAAGYRKTINLNS